MKRVVSILMAVVFVMSFVTLARAVEEIQRTELITAKATVQSVDQQSRMVTLKGTDGKTFDIKAGDEVKNFSQISPGDQVTAKYYRSMIVQMAKPGQEPMSPSYGSSKEAIPGGGVAAEQVKVTGTVVNIDKEKSEVTLKGPEGNMATVKAADPTRLAQLKIGDQLNITYTQALAVSLEKASG